MAPTKTRIPSKQNEPSLTMSFVKNHMALMLITTRKKAKMK